MRVFVTGAGGFIGKAVILDLLKNGHQVLGLARSDPSADAISKAGAEVLRGDIEDLESLENGAKSADGVIHLAFIHDFADFERVLAVDRAAIQTMGDAMTGTGKPLVIASGSMLLPKGSLATEDTPTETGSVFAQRAKSEDIVRALSKDKQVRGSVVRLSPTVHGAGDQGFITMLGGMARKNGFVTNVGDGSSRWPAVHRDDAATLFRLAVEKGAAGATYHGVAEQGIPTKEINDAISRKTGLPVENKSGEEAGQALGFFAMILGADNPVSSERTQKELGWHPTQPTLIKDIEANYPL